MGDLLGMRVSSLLDLGHWADRKVQGEKPNVGVGRSLRLSMLEPHHSEEVGLFARRSQPQIRLHILQQSLTFRYDSSRANAMSEARVCLH